MYILIPSESFENTYLKLVRSDKTLQQKFSKAFKQLESDPFYPSLNTHKVDTKKHKNVYSSWVSGDVRIIWIFDKEEKTIILVLETGTHSGSNKVYKKKSS